MARICVPTRSLVFASEDMVPTFVEDVLPGDYVWNGLNGFSAVENVLHHPIHDMVNLHSWFGLHAPPGILIVKNQTIARIDHCAEEQTVQGCDRLVELVLEDNVGAVEVNGVPCVFSRRPGNEWKTSSPSSLITSPSRTCSVSGAPSALDCAS